MTHHSRYAPDSFYQELTKHPQAYWRAIDAGQEPLINGDDGGTWNPSSAITIGGAGVGVGADWTLASGATIRTPSGSGKRIVHNDSDYIRFQAAKARSILNDCVPCLDACGGTVQIFYGESDFGSVVVVGRELTRAPARFVVPIRVHDGAEFVSAQLHFRVGQAHANVPATLPLFRTFKVDELGVLTPLYSTSPIDGGYVRVGNPGSGAAWYDSGNVKSVVYTHDANEIVDASRFAYYAEIVDESGANALDGNSYIAIATNFDDIFDLRPG